MAVVRVFHHPIGGHEQAHVHVLAGRHRRKRNGKRRSQHRFAILPVARSQPHLKRVSLTASRSFGNRRSIPQRIRKNPQGSALLETSEASTALSFARTPIPTTKPRADLHQNQVHWPPTWSLTFPANASNTAKAF